MGTSRPGGCAAIAAGAQEKGETGEQRAGCRREKERSSSASQSLDLGTSKVEKIGEGSLQQGAIAGFWKTRVVSYSRRNGWMNTFGQVGEGPLRCLVFRQNDVVRRPRVDEARQVEQAEMRMLRVLDDEAHLALESLDEFMPRR